MPDVGDWYEVELKEAHLKWGELGPSRRVVTRSYQEAYIQIPLSEARRLNILKAADYHAVSADGYLNHTVRATGSVNRYSPYAKQFQGKGDLKLIGRWLKDYLNAQVGDLVRVEFTSPFDVMFTFIRGKERLF